MIDLCTRANCAFAHSRVGRRSYARHEKDQIRRVLESSRHFSGRRPRRRCRAPPLAASAARRRSRPTTGLAPSPTGPAPPSGSGTVARRPARTLAPRGGSARGERSSFFGNMSESKKDKGTGTAAFASLSHMAPLPPSRADRASSSSSSHRGIRRRSPSPIPSSSRRSAVPRSDLGSVSATALDGARVIARGIDFADRHTLGRILFTTMQIFADNRQGLFERQLLHYSHVQAGRQQQSQVCSHL